MVKEKQSVETDPKVAQKLDLPSNVNTGPLSLESQKRVRMGKKSI